MTTITPTLTKAAPDVGSTVRRILKPLGLVAFIGGIAYVVLGPLVRLQSKAFADGAAGYRTAFGADRIWRTIGYTVGLALGSLAIAMVFGTLLAMAATRLPPRLRILRVVPVLPIVVPAIASVVGWAFLLSPRPGYLNAALRRLPWWSRPRRGPDRHLHAAVDRDHHRDRADRVRLPLRRRRLREHQRRAPRGCAGLWLVADRRVLQGHPAAAAPDAAVRRRCRPAARPRTVHRPAAARDEPPASTSSPPRSTPT